MKNSIFVIAILFSSFKGNAQTGSDLGIVIGANDLHRLNLEFSKPINETYKLRLGLMNGISNNSFYGGPGEIILASDSLIIERFDYHKKLQFTIFTGVERRFRESMFSISADLLVSYLRIDDGTYDWSREIQEDNSWIIMRSLNFQSDQNTALRKTDYINPGLQFKFSMNVPFKQYFSFHLSVGQILSSPIYLNEMVVTDPFNEFTPQKGTFNFNTTSQAGIGLIYHFKSK